MSTFPLTLAADCSAYQRRLARLQRLTTEYARPPRQRWPWLVLLAFALGFVAGSRVHASEASCVALQVRPTVMLRGGDIRIEMRVPRHEDHRRLVLAWDGGLGAGAGSITTQLEGEASEALFTRWLRAQPPAAYAFVALVYDNRGRIVGRDTAEIRTIEEAR